MEVDRWSGREGSALRPQEDVDMAVCAEEGPQAGTLAAELAVIAKGGGCRGGVFEGSEASTIEPLETTPFGCDFPSSFADFRCRNGCC